MSFLDDDLPGGLSSRCSSPAIPLTINQPNLPDPEDEEEEEEKDLLNSSLTPMDWLPR